MYNFYAVIIGTEILNNRREDKHFNFIKNLLALHGHTLFASFIIKDDKKLIRDIFKLVKEDANGVLFSFGGIGSTPDDLTRELAADVFTCKPLIRHQKFEQDIIDRFGEQAYPHRIHMAELPQDANLLFNPINNMSGFELDHRYFFVPGFPQMAHPMIQKSVEQYFCEALTSYRKTLLADTSENTLIDLMKEIPDDMELSSLPIFHNDAPRVELSLSYFDQDILEKYFNTFIFYLQNNQITYTIKE